MRFGGRQSLANTAKVRRTDPSATHPAVQTLHQRGSDRPESRSALNILPQQKAARFSLFRMREQTGICQWLGKRGLCLPHKMFDFQLMPLVRLPNAERSLSASKKRLSVVRAGQSRRVSRIDPPTTVCRLNASLTRFAGAQTMSI